MKKLPYRAAVCVLALGVLTACGNGEEKEPEQEGIQEEVVQAGADGEVEEEDGLHHHAIPFEWGATYELAEGTYSLQFNENPHGDETILVAYILDDGKIKDIDHHAAHVMEADPEKVDVEGNFVAESEYAYQLTLNQERTSYTFEIKQAGQYALFVEHHADEVKMQILDASGAEVTAQNPQEYEGHDHDHDHKH